LFIIYIYISSDNADMSNEKVINTISAYLNIRMWFNKLYSMINKRIKT